MKLIILLVIIGTTFLAIISTSSAQHSTASGSLFGYNVTITSSGGGNMTGTNFSYNVVIGEPVVGNASGTNYSYAFGFFHVVSRVFNFTGISLCVETWECTDWIPCPSTGNTTDTNFECRTCTDTSSCGTTIFKPVERRLISDFFIAIAILLSGVMIFIYKASVELPEKHWQLRMGLFYAALALGWGALNVVLRMATDSAASAKLVQSITIVYGAYTTIGVLAVIYLGIKFFQFTFFKFLAVANRKESEESLQAW